MAYLNMQALLKMRNSKKSFNAFQILMAINECCCKTWLFVKKALTLRHRICQSFEYVQNLERSPVKRKRLDVIDMHDFAYL